MVQHLYGLHVTVLPDDMKLFSKNKPGNTFSEVVLTKNPQSTMHCSRCEERVSDVCKGVDAKWRMSHLMPCAQLVRIGGVIDSYEDFHSGGHSSRPPAKPEYFLA